MTDIASNRTQSETDPGRHRTQRTGHTGRNPTITTAEAALRLHVSVRTIRSMIADGRLSAVRDGQRWLVSTTSVDARDAARSTTGADLPAAAHLASSGSSRSVRMPSHDGKPVVRGAAISATTLRTLVVVAALVLTFCSGLIARRELTSAPTTPSQTSLTIQPAATTPTEPVPLGRGLTILVAGAGLTIGVQLVAFSPLVGRRGRGHR